MYRQLLFALFFVMLGMVSCKSLRRDERDVAAVPQMVANNRQLAGAGLSAFGTLVSPLLFLMGMGSFISMLPQIFQTVLSGVGSNLFQSFTPGGSGGNPSSRLRRSVEDRPLVSDDVLVEIERRFNLAVLKNERPSV